MFPSIMSFKIAIDPNKLKQYSPLIKQMPI